MFMPRFFSIFLVTLLISISPQFLPSNTAEAADYWVMSVPRDPDLDWYILGDTITWNNEGTYCEATLAYISHKYQDIVGDQKCVFFFANDNNQWYYDIRNRRGQNNKRIDLVSESELHQRALNILLSLR